MSQLRCLRRILIMTENYGRADTLRYRSKPANGGAAQKPKCQTPIPTEVPTSNIQNSDALGLELGHWSFTGTWCLGFGIYSPSAVFWINSQTLRRCSSVVRIFPRPIRMTVRPRNFVCVM